MNTATMACNGLSLFMVKGKNANFYDFGKMKVGRHELHSCKNIHFVKGLCKVEILEKYGITEIEFDEICEKIKIKTHCSSCDCCF